MLNSGKILILGVLAVAGYSAFPTSLPTDAARRPAPFASRANAMCRFEHYFHFREMAKPAGLNAVRAPLGFDFCDPDQVRPEQPRVEVAADDANQVWDNREWDNQDWALAGGKAPPLHSRPVLSLPPIFE
jgi:hypothetical protein